VGGVVQDDDGEDEDAPVMSVKRVRRTVVDSDDDE
jgi:hypothetical protein